MLITSDHGFVQLLKHKELVVPVRNEAYLEVRRRYATDREDLDGVVIPFSDKPRVESTIVAPDRLEAMEDTLCHVEVRVVNRGTSLVTVRFTIAHEAPKMVDISQGGEASYAVDLAMTLELRYVTLIVEAKGSNGTFAPVQGGTRQIPITVRHGRIKLNSAVLWTSLMTSMTWDEG